MYDPGSDSWLSVNTDPETMQRFDNELICELLEIGNIEQFLDLIESDRVIIQFKALLHPDSNLEFTHYQDVHAAVLQKSYDGWWLLDSFEHCPINLREDKQYAHAWLSDI